MTSPELLDRPARYVRTERHVGHVMGTAVSVALRGRHADTRLGRTAWADAMAELRTWDRVFSTYREGSIISRLGRGELAVRDCPPEVVEVLELGARAARESGGAFDVWRPDRDGIRRLDPSGVVKGWALERAAAPLKVLGDTAFCLSGGGDMVCRVAAPDLPDWRIGIEHPHDPRQVVAVVPLRDGAIATSGFAHRGAHIVDARTGKPATGVASVTVVAGTLTEADIDATAAFARGPDAAHWLAGRPGRAGYVVWPDGSTTVTAA